MIYYLLFYSTDTNLTQGRPGAISSIGPDYRKASGNSTRKVKNSARNSRMWRLRTVLDIGTPSLTVSEMCFFSKSFRPSLGILSPARNASLQSVDSNLAAALTGVGMNGKPQWPLTEVGTLHTVPPMMPWYCILHCQKRVLHSLLLK